MCVFIAVDIAYLLRRAGHFSIPGQIVEEHEAGIEIHPLQNIIRHHHLQQREGILLFLEFIVQIPDKCVAAQQMLIRFPLVQNVVALRGAAYGVQHVAVALAVHTFLKCLNRQAQIHLVGCDIFANAGQVGRLDGIQKHKKAQYFIVGPALGCRKVRVILHILREVYLLRYPEIIHGLPVPAAYPGIAHIVEIVQVGGVAAYHAPQAYLSIAAGVEQRFFHKFCHGVFSPSALKTSSFRTLPLPETSSAHSK